MLFRVIVVVLAVRLSRGDVVSNQYCTDMRPQSYITIEQLLGMWYGVERISHKRNEQRTGVRYVDSCPVIHISEDHSVTPPPFFFGGGNTYRPYGTPNNQDNYHTQRNEYSTLSPYSPGPYYGPNYRNYGQYNNMGQRLSTEFQGKRIGPDEYPRRYADDIKMLRLRWTDNGIYTEYDIRYNVTTPGFWMSSGPQNGSALEYQFNQFAGTIQVIKAVGNQLVLTFCFQLPDQQLYTILLSRVPKLAKYEISDIHDLLTQRALETHNIMKVCSENSSATGVKITVHLLVVYFFISLFLRHS